jgi:hypothetical protein
MPETCCRATLPYRQQRNMEREQTDRKVGSNKMIQA